MKAVFLLGLPGSGKGTQAEKISWRFGLVHIMTSRIIREKMESEDKENDSEIDMKEEKRKYYAGELNTPYAVIKWLKDKIIELNNLGKGIVFDGSPRTLPEAEAITEVVDNLYGRENIFPIEIKISYDTSRQRLGNRRICSKCGRPVIYSDETKDLKTCPYSDCGGELIKRELDDPKTIETRLKEFDKLTQPAIDFFKHQNRLYTVDGEKDVEGVFAQIEVILNLES